MEILFKTPHGSKLYGLNHAGSDDDWYTVVVKPPTKKARYSTHKIIDNDDSVVVDFGTWLELCRKGVPQALEAMFSDMAVTDKVADLRAGFYVGTGVYDTYMRTIKSFAYGEGPKQRRHALRLGLNMRDIRQYGRFDPRLKPHTATIFTGWANTYEPDLVYHNAVQLAWS